MNRRTRARPCQSALAPSSKLETALALHDQGFWIAICDGKRPIHADWQNQPLTKKGIRTMLEDHPDGNIAVVLSHSPVIDIECDCPEAEKALHRLFKEAGAKLPDTPTYRSKRGNHRLFARPRGLPNAAVVTIQGIEFRLGANGKGATSTIPPSVHPDGPKYRWRPGRSIFEVTPAPLPKEVVRRLHEAGNRLDETLAQPIGNGQLVPRGNRSSYLARIAGAMRRVGLSADEMLPSLEAANANRCDPALPSSELVSIANSVGRYPPTDPMLPSLLSLNSQGNPELPPAAYHGLAGEILNAIDPFTEAAPAALLAHVLVAFGVRIGRKPHFMVQHDRHVPRVFALVVGQTAKGRKGTSWGTPRALFGRTEKD